MNHRAPAHRRRIATPLLAGLSMVALLAAGLILSTGLGHRQPAAGPLPATTFSAVDPPPPIAPSARTRSAAGRAEIRADPVEASDPPSRPAPDHLYVPSLGIAAAFVSEHITGSALGLPADVHVVGLNVDGASLTAVTGTVLLAGHVDYVGQGDGSLYPLSRIRPAARIWITDQDGRLTGWRVTGLVDPLKADLDQTIFDSSGPRRLVLVTCGGQVHDGNYDRNVVVYAEPVPG